MEPNYHIIYKVGNDNEENLELKDYFSKIYPKRTKGFSEKTQVNSHEISSTVIKGYITKINERGKQLTIQIGPKMSSNLPIKKTIFKYNVFSKIKKVYNKPQAYFYELMRTCNKFLLAPANFQKGMWPLRITAGVNPRPENLKTKKEALLQKNANMLQSFKNNEVKVGALSGVDNLSN